MKIIIISFKFNIQFYIGLLQDYFLNLKILMKSFWIHDKNFVIYLLIDVLKINKKKE